MPRLNPHSETHAWLCTAYNEAGHAVVALLLGRDLYWVEVIDSQRGVTWSDDRYDQFIGLVELSNRERRVRAGLLRYWLETFWILNACVIAVAEFNLVPENVVARGAMGDQIMKTALIRLSTENDLLDGYYYRNVDSWIELITQDCQIFFRQTRVSSLTRTLAEALLRSRRLSGDEVLDIFLTNHAVLTGQRDLFWRPTDENPYQSRQAIRRPVQRCLF